MKNFYVLTWDTNSKSVEYYNVMPYFIEEYNSLSTKDRPKTYEEFKKFVEQEGKYRFWSRCEYEMIISSWPPDKNPMEHTEKIDIWQQIDMNLDIFVEILMKNVL